MRILVTGATGLCGTQIITELIKDDQVSAVFGVDNFSRGYPCKDRYVIPDKWQQKFRLVTKGFQDLTVKELNSMDVDVVIHLAAYNSSVESMSTPEEYLLNNDYGTLQLLDKLLHTKNTPFFIFSSTTEVYGKPSREPVTEESPTSCLNLFSASKLAGENYCNAFFNWYNYPLVKLRISNVYGKNENILGYTSEISNFIAKALRGEPLVIYGCGSQRRDFIFSGDLAEAIKKAITKREALYGQTLNIASGKIVTVQELAAKTIALTNSTSEIIKLPVSKGDCPGFAISISKAQRLMGWEAMISLHDGLTETINWHQKL